MSLELDMQTLISNSVGERLDTCYHPGTREDVLVVLGHGVTGDKDRPLLLAVANGLAENGWPCLRVSFSGNGQSGGKFEESTITKEVGDLQAVLSAIPEGVKVIYAGHSMGGAVGVRTAAAEGSRIDGLISLAGMVHTAEFLKREFGDLIPDQDVMWEEPDCPLSRLYVEDLNAIHSTIEDAARVLQPWLLIHGTDDDVIPLQDSRDARDAAHCEKDLLEIAGAGHVFDDESYPRIVDGISTWLERYFGKLS